MPWLVKCHRRGPHKGLPGFGFRRSKLSAAGLRRALDGIDRAKDEEGDAYRKMTRGLPPTLRVCGWSRSSFNQVASTLPEALIHWSRTGGYPF
jgi:hypothetical protein